ncbi:MAG TPA: cupredoxin family copper-binding protein [Dehalococcoidia bacterium]|nr:cupredoxin family copper-binding protein [Dehalococcoidia bacterium]
MYELRHIRWCSLRSLLACSITRTRRWATGTAHRAPLLVAAGLVLLITGAACSSGNNGYGAKTAPGTSAQPASTQPAAAVVSGTGATAVPSAGAAAALTTPAASASAPATAAPATPSATAPAAGGAGAEQAVTISGFAFAPATLRVPVGATVTWTNKDAVTHTVTPDAEGITDRQLAAGAAVSQTFTTPGTFSYHCSIHPFMKGTIIVGG